MLRYRLCCAAGKTAPCLGKDGAQSTDLDSLERSSDISGRGTCRSPGDIANHSALFEPKEPNIYSRTEFRSLANFSPFSYMRWVALVRWIAGYLWLGCT